LSAGNSVGAPRKIRQISRGPAFTSEKRTIRGGKNQTDSELT
jgi:hypothetical protein